jgi:hypothetical protein
MNSLKICVGAALAAAFSILTTTAQAQIQRGAGGEVQDAQIVIDKELDLVLPEADRNFEKILLPERTSTNPPLQYNLNPLSFQLPYVTPRVRIVTIKQDPLPKLNGNYVKAGLGNYGTTYLEGYYNSKRVENYSYGVNLRHLASARGPVDGINSGTSENLFNMYGNYFTKRVIMGADFSYLRERYGFYGYNQEIPTPDKSDINQVFHTGKIGATLQNATKDAKFNWDLGLGVVRFSDLYEARESEFLTNLNTGYRLASGSDILLNVELSNSNRKDTEQDNNRLFVGVRPAYRFTHELFSITAGANVVYENDTIGDASTNNNNMHVYPHVNVDYNLLGNNVIAFAGLTGDMQKTTLRSFINENPFLAPNVELRHTNKAMEIYGGIRGNVGGRVAYEARLGFQNYRNLPFYVNTTEDTTKFEIVYDRGTAVLNFIGDVSYQLDEKFRIGARVDYNNYTMGTEDARLARPWHRPALRTSLITTYNLNKKILLHNTLYYNSSIFALNPNTMQAQELKGFVDLNIKVDYNIKDRYSVFLNIDNLLNQRNPRFLYYPTRGTLVMIGATYSL